MSFFEPPARPTAEVARAKVVSPPAWIAPPHNVLPGIAPVQLIVARTDETVAADAGSAGSEKLAEAAFRDERLEHGAEVAVGETAESAEKPDWPVGGDVAPPGHTDRCGERGDDQPCGQAAEGEVPSHRGSIPRAARLSREGRA
jgi:hypothetical protein